METFPWHDASHGPGVGAEVAPVMSFVSQSVLVSTVSMLIVVLITSLLNIFLS